MKKILYYVTDNGLGHLTRTISIIREFDNDVEFIIRHSNEKIIKNSLPNSIVLSGKTDQGSILLNDKVSIDWNKTGKIMNDWYKNYNQKIITEKNNIKKSRPDLIISDITPIPFLPAKELEIPIIAISNFTWLDFLEKLPLTNSEFLINSYESASLAIQLPLSTPMEIFNNKKKVDLVSKFSTKTRDKIRQELGLKNSDFMVFVNLPNFYNISFPLQRNLKVFSTGATTNIEKTEFIEPWIEGQNLNFAADLVLSKCGYGMISECLTSGTPFRFLIDETHPEQIAIRKYLKFLNFDNVIFSDNSGKIKFELSDLDIHRYEPFKRDNLTVKNMIMEFFK
jgi:uncharacterized protein (TIGR00661 family)